MNHNQFIFTHHDGRITLLRKFEEMYRQCPDPHGQSEEMARLDYQLILTVVRRALMAKGPTSPVRVLDVGCGLGYFTAQLKCEFPAAQVAGCDISPTAVATAAKNAPGCDFFEFDLKRPVSSPAGPYDLLVALDVLYYFTEEEIPRVLANVSGLLASQGMVLVGYHLPKVMNFGRYIQNLEDARGLFARHGFTFCFTWEVNNDLDVTYAGDPVGRHIYFLARRT